MMSLVADILLLATDTVDSDVYLSVQHISFKRYLYADHIYPMEKQTLTRSNVYASCCSTDNLESEQCYLYNVCNKERKMLNSVLRCNNIEKMLPIYVHFHYII